MVLKIFEITVVSKYWFKKKIYFCDFLAPETKVRCGAIVLCPAELWSNATFAPQTHGDIVSRAKIKKQKISKFIFSYKKK